MPRDGADHGEDKTVFRLESCHSRLAEVWMLIDFVTGRCDRKLDDIKVTDRKTKQVMEPQALLDELHAIADRLEAKTPDPGDCSFVEVVRDALNGLVKPATSLTVAYTALVTGPFRKQETSRADMAARAFPNLLWLAAWHRPMQAAVIVFAIVITLFVSYESARVALGKALVQTLTDLQVTQAQLATETAKLDIKSNPAPGTATAGYRVCDRPIVAYAALNNMTVDAAVNAPRARMLTYDSPEAADVCGRDAVLRAHLDTARSDLRNYVRNWRSVMWPGNANTASKGTDGTEDVELRVAPVLLVWGNLLLPILFATIGSAIFVMLDYYQKIKASELDPRDFFLAPVRLVLGFVVGACIGLLFSAAGPATATAPSTAATVVSSLTLTASGVAFLVGFAVESVFTMLNGLIGRIFTTDGAAAK